MKSRKSYCTTPDVAVGVGGGVGVSKKFNVKVFYVMGKALSGELSCPCDRSCSIYSSAHITIFILINAFTLIEILPIFSNT